MQLAVHKDAHLWTGAFACAVLHTRMKQALMRCPCPGRRNARLAEALAAATQLGERVAADNRNLEAEARVRDRDTFEVDEYLRQDLAECARQIAELRDGNAEARHVL